MKHWYLRVLLAGSLMTFAGCPSDPEEEPTDTTDVIDGDTGGETDGGETDGGETDGGETVGGETDGGETDGGETDGGETDGGETDGGGGEAGVCVEDSDCGARRVCLEGECLSICGENADCDDRNPCTVDSCSAGGYCENVPTEAVLPDVSAGDCRRQACVDGVIEVIASPEDTPVADDNPCTIERCNGQFPQYFPDNSLCDDGDPDNGYEFCDLESNGCSTGDLPPWVCDDFVPGYDDIETCGDGVDNDGNGMVDDGCPCSFGEAQRCFVGAPNARGVGGCSDGFQQCIDRNDPHWSDCSGGIGQEEEVCDSKDNDCNGCVDDIEGCQPLLACPDRDSARPLRYYPLDGPSILDAEGEEWTWTVEAPPNSATVAPEDPNAPVTRVYLDVSGDYRITVSVLDDKGNRFGCSWIVNVAGSGLRVEMRWDTFGSVDMDLHMHRSGNTENFCTSADCYYANCRVYHSGLDWGYTASPGTECELSGGSVSCPNPRLDIDNISGYDPENINIDNPNNGDTFRVMAHKFSGSRITNPVLSFYCGGRLRAVLGEAPDLAQLDDSGGGCNGDTWRVADVSMFVDADTGLTDCLVQPLLVGNGWDIREDDNSY